MCIFTAISVFPKVQPSVLLSKVEMVPLETECYIPAEASRMISGFEDCRGPIGEHLDMAVENYSPSLCVP